MEQSSTLPDGQSLASQSSSQSPYPSVAHVNTRASRDEVINPNTKRLQLRSTAFRGPKFPARRISPLAAQILEKSGSPLGPINENTPLELKKGIIPKKGSPSNPVNVLQEIHNSAGGKRNSPRPKSNAVSKDGCPTSEQQSPTSWYISDINTPPNFSVNTMSYHITSQTQAIPPPLTSPLARKINGRRPNAGVVSSTSPEQSKYIEHLESKLAAAQAKLDTLMSPTTNKARAAKLRALTNENRALHLDLREWEQKFAARVHEEILEHTETETSLRARVQALQHELGTKEVIAENTERELSSLRLKVKEVESLRATNSSLERRIDVLASLLTRSPSKTAPHSTLHSPSTEHPAMRSGRPASTIPRLPTSPNVQSFSPVDSKDTPFSPHGRTPFPGTSGCADSDHSLHSIDELLESPGGIAFKGHARSFDSKSRAYQSTPSLSTGPTSVRSSMSATANTWGLPLAHPLDVNPRPKQRPMRRFLSGAGSLKPLILQATAIAPSPPLSPPNRSPPVEPARDVSRISVDPTTAFLSHELLSSPVSVQSTSSTQSMQLYSRSSILAHEEALQALEGRIRQLERSQASVANDEEGVGLGIDTPSPNERIPQARRSRKERPRSLHEELQNLDDSIKRSYEDGLIAIDAEDVDEQLNCVPIGINSISGSPPPSPISPRTIHHLHHGHRPTQVGGTPESPKPEHAIFKDRQEPNHLTILPSDPVHGLFNRLTSLISSRKQKPLFLAQRLLWNAWVLGAASFGGVGWWLLGLAFRPSGHQTQGTTNAATAGKSTPEERHGRREYFAQVSRSRAACHYVKRSMEHGVSADSHSEPSRSVPETRHGLLDEPHVFPCDDCKEPSTRENLRLWLRFTLTIVLAVGVAIKHGPGAVLDHRSLPPSPPPPYQAENHMAKTISMDHLPEDPPPIPRHLDTGPQCVHNFEFAPTSDPWGL